MTDYAIYSSQLQENGFCVIGNIFTADETETIAATIAAAGTDAAFFHKTGDLFAIRQLLKVVPGAMLAVFTQRLKQVISSMFGGDYFIVKSIYFDKPPASNWFVARHQDLTISVDKKIPVEGYGSWTAKQDQFSVQPPLAILEDNFTIRIHLDDTEEQNGALKVLPGSHAKGIFRPGNNDINSVNETVCPVSKGSIMIMKPLLVHASGRSTNGQRRRVVHIEFSRRQLPAGMQWAERQHWQ